MMCENGLSAACPSSKSHYMMTSHEYINRIVKEMNRCESVYPEIVQKVRVANDDICQWKVTLRNGVKVRILIPTDFPFVSPRFELTNFEDPHGLIACECEAEWHTASRIGKSLFKLYTDTTRITESKH